MNSLGKRIAGRIEMTTKSFRSDLHFSMNYALLRIMNELGGRLRLRRLATKAGKKKSKWIEDYLKSTLSSVIEQYHADTDCGTYEPGSPIWVCWWTGEETAPALVKRCIESIRNNANGHPVHFITENNFREYLEIPDHILGKLENGSMCVAHCSDYIRFSLLAKYGGWWLDATIFCADQLPEEIFRMPVFTCKGRTGDGDYYSDYQWTTFCFGGYRNNVMFRFVRALLDAYWKQNEAAIDYLFLDYLIKLVYTENETCKKLLDSIPDNNLRRDDLQAAMNEVLPALEIRNIIQNDTILYKLSWREKYKETTPEGGDSVYGAFIKGFG